MLLYSKEQLNNITLESLQETLRGIDTLGYQIADNSDIKIAFFESLENYLYEIHKLIMRWEVFWEYRKMFSSLKDEITTDMLKDNWDSLLHSSFINRLKDNEASLWEVVKELVENTKLTGFFHTESGQVAYSWQSISKYWLISVFFYEGAEPKLYL